MGQGTIRARVLFKGDLNSFALISCCGRGQMWESRCAKGRSGTNRSVNSICRFFVVLMQVWVCQLYSWPYLTVKKKKKLNSVTKKRNHNVEKMWVLSLSWCWPAVLIKFYASVSLSVRFFSFIVWFFFMLLLFVFFSVDFVNPLINLLAFFHYSLDTWI